MLEDVLLTIYMVLFWFTTFYAVYMETLDNRRERVYNKSHD